AASPAQSITRPLTGHAQYGPADAHPPIIAINSKKVFHIVNYVIEQVSGVRAFKRIRSLVLFSDEMSMI
ncbi:MAG: hypothetical protein J7K81_00985, partial [Methanophagales archaeon]|nr:hypothetical protein [Methanophagales archaeon]